MVSAVARSLQNLDQFRVVSRDLTKGTLTGGLFTAAAYAILVLLVLAEFGAFLRVTHTTQVIMDNNKDENIQLNFDITVFDLPCKYLKLSVWDKYGTEQMKSNDTLKYLPIDHKGSYKGASYTKEEIIALEAEDTKQDITADQQKELDADWASSDDHFKHNDFNSAVTNHDFTLVNFYAGWCVHCRQFYPSWLEWKGKIDGIQKFSDSKGQSATTKWMGINCVDFGAHCQQAQIAAFPTLRLYKRDGSFEAFAQKRTYENLVGFLTSTIKNSHLIATQHHLMFSEGCQVQGNLQVPRVPGVFYLQAEAFGSVDINPAITNVSHTVNHLSFGDKDTKKWAERNNIPKEVLNQLNPLDARTFVAEHFHEAPQHYLKVVSTHMQGKKESMYQMTHTDRIRKLRKNMIDKAPQARFSYDFSPMSVVIKTKSKRWYEFLTSLFAILGGTFTIIELTSGAVDTVNTAVKEAMGKAS